MYESGATDPIFGRDRKHQLARARCSSCAVSAAIAPAQLPLNLPTDPFSARPDPPTHGACTWRCKPTNHFRRPCLSDVRAAPRALSAHPRFRCPLRPTRLAGGRTPPTEPNAAHGALPPPPPPPPARAAAKAKKKTQTFCSHCSTQNAADEGRPSLPGLPPAQAQVRRQAPVRPLRGELAGMPRTLRVRRVPARGQRPGSPGR